MEYQELLKKRTSSRKYTDQPLTDSEIRAVLKAGEYAPVGSNRYHDLRFTVVTDHEVLRKLAEAALIRRSNTGEMAKIINNVSNAAEILEQKNAYDPFYDAPAVIFISHRKQDLEPHIEWCNAASAALSMHLAAQDLGLGSCFMWFALDSMRRIPELDHTDLLGLPEDFQPLLGLTLGHIKEPLPERDIDTGRIAVNWIGEYEK